MVYRMSKPQTDWQPARFDPGGVKRRVTAWVRVRPTGLLGALLLILGILWIWAGWSTWNDLIGKPRDAPHLRLSGHFRALVWWASGLVAIVACVRPLGSRLRAWSWVALTVMPTVRAASYFISWVATWGPIDALIPDRVLKGQLTAWGSMWVYLALDALILCTARIEGRAIP